jgi:hypothetical protein
MKTRLIVIIALWAISSGAVGQNFGFARVFDEKGMKIAKGKVVSVTESLLQLRRNGQVIDLPVSDIFSIKTKRSAGNNIAIGAGVGAVTMAILGIVSADEDAYIFAYNETEGAASGLLLGAPMGAAVGGITALFKGSRTFDIGGDGAKMKAFETYLLSVKK